jgi:ubiquinol-cytochrome c reductase cytochrome b subunit
MFTGYVLKGDLSGLSAGEVSLTIVKETPILNNFLFLFHDSTDFFWKFYIWHILFLPILLTYFTYVHANHVITKYITIAIGFTFLVMTIFSMPKDVFPYDNVATIHVTGPWFFRGAENLLMLGVSTIIVDFVLFCLFLLLILYFYMEKHRKLILILLLIWILLYAYISFI